MDTSLIDPRALRDAAERFAPLAGLFVGAQPPLAVSEQWEAARGARPIGQPRRHDAAIHAHGTCDLTLDPSALSPHKCALAIVRRLTAGPSPTAFRRLLEAS